MITHVHSAALRGVDAREVEVEINVRNSEKPLVIVVGLPVNLAPADLKKEGPSFDLPIALAMASASENSPLNADDCCIVDELALDGMVRAVKGVLSITLEAKRRGRLRILVPEARAF